MTIVPDGRQRAHLPPHLEALELRDFNARDRTPTQDPDAFPPDAVTEAEVDAMYVAEMERRDRDAARPVGYRDAACEACGTALFVPVGQAGDVLCPQCQREGEALAAAEDSVADDDDPRPPAGGAVNPTIRSLPRRRHGCWTTSCAWPSAWRTPSPCASSSRRGSSRRFWLLCPRRSCGG